MMPGSSGTSGKAGTWTLAHGRKLLFFYRGIDQHTFLMSGFIVLSKTLGTILILFYLQIM